ncbi:MAG: sulfite exporter TauE/SafE family protein [Sulfurospirillaceae bacterium]|jgi:uncharacterized membrane protein YfcA|nr:sulfite exporter TauE/SafE family protein [Sulfurospirillaceae bacterium]MDD2825561.1 sulfite exporter TauE/SafE family protein [Sulfurospirillaceae bacterium]
MDDYFFWEVLIVFASGMVHGIVGFGFPMIATPLLATFMDLKRAVLYTLIPTLVVNSTSIKRNNSFTQIWKEYKVLILSVMAGSLIGTHILVAYYSDYYKLILAFVILMYLNKERFKISLTPYMEHHTLAITLILGFASGIVGGIVNIMIPVLLILIIELKLEKKRAIGVMNLCFITNKSLQIIIFGYHGSFTTESLLAILPLTLIAVIGFSVGSKIQDKIDEELYKKLLNISLWFLSAYLIYATFYSH